MRLRRYVALTSLTALLALAGSACSGGSDRATSTTAPVSTAPPSTSGSTPATTASPEPSTGASTSSAPGAQPERSAGCGTGFYSGLTEQTIVSGADDRTFRLALHAGYSGDDPLPLVLNWHGYGSDAAQQAVYSELEQKGPAAGYAIVTPQGTGSPARWNIFSRGPGLDDVRFAEDLIDWAASTLCIDTARVYSTGMSNGAGMSVFLACEIPDRIAAIAPVAGVNLVDGCAGAPIDVLAFHGDADPVVPYAGGSVTIAPQLEIASVADSIAGWAERAGCDDVPRAEAISANVERRSFGGCDSGTEVMLYTVEGGGHTWPGSIDVPRLGPVTDEIDAAELILAFFDTH